MYMFVQYVRPPAGLHLKKWIYCERVKVHSKKRVVITLILRVEYSFL